MKYLAIFMLILMGCATSSDKNEVEPSLTEEELVETSKEEIIDDKEAEANLDDFIEYFAESIMSHDAEQCLSFFDEEYREEQLTFLERDVDLFLKEFFCGVNYYDEFTCVDLEDIDKIEFFNLTLEEGGTGFIIEYLITAGDQEIRGDTYIKEVVLDDGYFSYGFVGAVG